MTDAVWIVRKGDRYLASSQSHTTWTDHLPWAYLFPSRELAAQAALMWHGEVRMAFLEIIE